MLTMVHPGDVVGESVGVQVAEQFDHRRVTALDVGATERRVSRAAEEGIRSLLEVLDADPGECGQDPARQDPHVGVVPRVVLDHDRTEPTEVALEGGLPRLTVAQLRLSRGHLDEAAEDEVELDRHGLLAPQRAVVVEHRDPFLDRHGDRSVLSARAPDEVADRLFGWGVTPSREQLLGHGGPTTGRW